jgi:methylglutaconyl-CoA hydratase
VQTVVPERTLDSEVERYIDQILTSSPSAIAQAKRLIRDVQGQKPAEVIGLTTLRIAEQRTSAEGQEGMRAFLEKRKPSWID